jgi:hypothetical protein
MENNQFERIDLADVYRRGYLKIYGNFLGLDTVRLLKDYQKEISSTSSLPANHPLLPDVLPGVVEHEAPVDSADVSENVVAPKTFETTAFEPRPLEGNQRLSQRKKSSFYKVFIILASISCVCLFGYAIVGYILPGVKTLPDKKSTPVEKTPVPGQYTLKIWVSEPTTVTLQQQDGAVVWKDKEFQAGRVNEQEVVVKGGVIVLSPKANVVNVQSVTNGQNFTASGPGAKGFKLDEKFFITPQATEANLRP